MEELFKRLKLRVQSAAADLLAAADVGEGEHLLDEEEAGESRENASDLLEAPEQLGFAWCGRQVLVDGITDPKYGEGIRYIGLATHVFDDIYRCVAVAGGALCVVEVTIRLHDDVLPSPAARIG